MNRPDKVTIVEVGPRDGLQNEPQPVGLATRVRLIRDLAAAGVSVIETGAFVSPKWVPQMAASEDVLRQVADIEGVRLPVLVPNMAGYERAKAAGAREIAVFAAASEAFSRKNINCTIDESLARFEQVTAAAAADGMAVRGYVSCVLGCPYQGEVPAAEVAAVAARLVEIGCFEVSLGDTIGVGTPGAVRTLLTEVNERVPMDKLAVHFHDTYGQAIANIMTALDMGVSVVDSAVAGLGGCPYASGASGNVATEDVVYLMEGLGIETGIDLEKVAAAGWAICDVLNKVPAGRVSQALRAKA